MEDFYGPAAKKSIAAAVEEICAGTTLPIVVSVQHRVGSYPEAGLRGGLLVAALYLALFLCFPEPFDAKYLFVELAVAFVIGAVMVSSSETLWRRATTEARRSRAVADAARSKFAESTESCVLVFVATAEARVEVVADIGTRNKLGVGLTEAAKMLDRAVRLDRDRERFERALRELGEIAREAFPDHEDETTVPTVESEVAS